jgi:hypothetical protein
VEGMVLHVVRSCDEMLLWLIPQIDHVPRARRFTAARRA